MERGDKVQITIEDISTEGQGIGRADGLAVFVREAVIGDFVLAELTKVKKNYAFGEIREPAGSEEKASQGQAHAPRRHTGA